MTILNKKNILILSGFDPSGFAGFSCDIKIAEYCGVHGLGLLTALTSQNPKKLNAIDPIHPELFSTQLETTLDYFTIHAVKIGMIYSMDIMNIICRFLDEHPQLPVVIDPILKASTGSSLTQQKKLDSFHEIFKKATILTPNIPEALHLLNLNSYDSMNKLAVSLLNHFNTSIYLKGGHADEPSELIKDLFIDHKQTQTFERKSSNSINTHGTGCMLSTALTSFLAKDFSPIEASRCAFKFMTQCFENPEKIGNEFFLSRKGNKHASFD